MRVTLIHNDGGGSEEQPGARALQEMVVAAGHELTYCSCRDDWEAALREPADLIAIAGGDGTVGSVAKRLLAEGKARVPVAAIPLGTANNVSKVLGIASMAPDQWVRAWPHAGRLSVDVGVALGPWGKQYFIEGFGVGLFANSLSQADESRVLKQLPAAEAKIAYSLQMLKEQVEVAAPLPLRLQMDGRDLSGEYLLVEIMNIGLVGPNLWLAPRHALDDGLFDVVLAPTASRGALLDALRRWQREVWKQPELPTLKGKTLEIEWSGFPVHMDDVLWPYSGADRPPPPATLTLRIERSALQFLVPAGKRTSTAPSLSSRRAA